MKVLPIIFLIISVGVWLNEGHNVTWGVMSQFNQLLARDFVQNGATWMITKSVDVIYPPKGHFNNRVLKAIRVFDWGGPKHFSYTSLVKGGPGHLNATIHFKSQRGKGINCTVEYYA